MRSFVLPRELGVVVGSHEAVYDPSQGVLGNNSGPRDTYIRSPKLKNGEKYEAECRACPSEDQVEIGSIGTGCRGRIGAGCDKCERDWIPPRRLLWAVACLSSSSSLSSSTVTGSSIWGWNFTSSENGSTGSYVNNSARSYPNGLHVGTQTYLVRNRNSGTARSVYVWEATNLGGPYCHERAYDSITWRTNPASGIAASLTVDGLNVLPCPNF